MRLLHVIASSHGGGAAHVRDLAQTLPADFAQTVVMPLDGGNVSAADITAVSAHFVPLNLQQGFNLNQLWQLRRLLQNGRFHLLHLHGARAALYGRLATIGLQPRPRTIFTIHGFATPFYAAPQRQLYLALERWLQQRTDHTICVAQAEADLFLQHGLTRPQKVSVIHPGIDVAGLQGLVLENGRLRQELGIAADAPLLLTACRLHIPRDFETLLAAFAQVRQQLPQAVLLIAGDGPQRQEIGQRINQLELSKQVRLLGFRRDVAQLMALADLFVLTSSGWEGFPLSTLEAQAMGTPVVVSDAGGSAEAVLHEQTGLVVPRQDATALAAALLRLLMDKALRQRLGQNGRLRAPQELTREQMAAAITAVYRGTLPVRGVNDDIKNSDQSN